MDTPPNDDSGDEVENSGVVVVREDDPETGETVVRRYPAPDPRHEADS